MNGTTLIAVVPSTGLASHVNSATAETAARSAPYAHGSYMMGWNGGWYEMLLGSLFMILALAVVIAVALLLVRWLSGLPHPLHPPSPPQARRPHPMT